MRATHIQRLLACAGIAGTLALGAASAQQQPPTPPAPTTPPTAPPPAPTEPQPPEGGELPSLDDLLGTGKGGSPAPRAGDASETDLQRRLDAHEAGDAFQQAVTLMGDAAGRLTKSRDTSTATQRIQEDIIRKLDILIAQAEQQSASSSQSQSRQRSQDDMTQNSARQQSRAQRNQAGSGENQAELEPPPREDGPLRPELDPSKAAWGALPERVRDMLLQGSGDKFSDSYKKLTEAYYRTLAEGARK